MLYRIPTFESSLISSLRGKRIPVLANIDTYRVSQNVTYKLNILVCQIIRRKTLYRNWKSGSANVMVQIAT